MSISLATYHERQRLFEHGYEAGHHAALHDVESLSDEELAALLRKRGWVVFKRANPQGGAA